MTQWEKIAGAGVRGSWNHPDLRAVRSYAVANGFLYCGVYGDLSGAAQVWKYDHQEWQLVFCAEAENLPFDRVDCMTFDPETGQIYAGLGLWYATDFGAAILKIDLSDGSDKVDISFIQNKDLHAIESIAIFKGELYAGCMSNNPDFHGLLLKSSTNQEWKIAARISGCAHVYSMCATDEKLFLGTFDKSESAKPRLISYDGTGFKMELGPGSPLGWSAGRAQMVQSIQKAPDGSVYVTINDLPTAEQPTVWKISGEEKVPVPCFDKEGVIGSSYNFNCILPLRDGFLLTSGMTPADDKTNKLRVWRAFDSGEVRSLGGGTEGSWSDVSVFEQNPRGHAWIYRVLRFGDDMIAFLSFGVGGGQCEVWKFEGFDWSG